MYDRGGQVEPGCSPWRSRRIGPIRGSRTPLETNTHRHAEPNLASWYFTNRREDPMSTTTQQVAATLRSMIAEHDVVYGVVAYVRYADRSEIVTNLMVVAEMAPDLGPEISYVDRGRVEQFSSYALVPNPEPRVPAEVRSGIDMVLDGVIGRGRRVVPEVPSGDFLVRLCRMGLFPVEWGELASVKPESVLYYRLAAMPKEVKV